ncbi:MAG: bifunctional metallophosphatase/5'-nucleotidase [Bacteroidota bacterium]
MLRQLSPLALATLLVAFAACGTVQPVRDVVEEDVEMVMDASDGRVHVTLLQVNDVYEITPVEGGKTGGLARVATVLRELKEANPNTFFVLPGDFFSPSAIGTSKVDGVRLNGKQMVAVLNAVGVDYATYGNHEFDLDAEDFFMRVDEGDYTWVSSNVTGTDGQLYDKTVPHELVTVTDEDGTATIGFVGATIASNPTDYVRYEPYLEALQEEVAVIEDEADAIVALTHLSLDQDIRVAVEVPAIDLILGGHEHENIEVFRGSDFTPIVKADANARTAYVHHLYINPATGDTEIESTMVPITDAIPDDPEVAAVVDEWLEIGFAGFITDGFDPGATVVTITEPLDGREASVRNQPTGLTDLIAEAMLAEVPDAQVAIYNGGSIRIDDVIPPGPVTQYDVIRVLPFGGKVLTTVMQGDLLARVLDQGMANKGAGGYLQTAGVERSAESWMVDGQPLDPSEVYRVAINDFLMLGLEMNLEIGRESCRERVLLDVLIWVLEGG